MHTRQFGSLQNQLILDVTSPADQVVAQGTGQQLDVLGHVADVVAQFADVDLANVHAIDQQRAAVGLVQADDELGQRALARATAADDAHLLAGTDGQVDVLQGLVLLVRVGEIDPAELDAALQHLAAQRAFFEVSLLRQLHHVVGGDHGHLGLLVAGEQAVELAKRAEGTAAEHVASHQAAHAQVAVDDQVHADADHCHACQLLDQQGDVHRQARQHLHPQLQAA
ncbi:hypothetical protein D3C75_862410 [compost metagenome]